MLNDPGLVAKVDAAAAGVPIVHPTGITGTENRMAVNKNATKEVNKMDNIMQIRPGDNSMLSQVAGILLGSPEYQRR
jgi:predicted aconitase